MQPYGLMRPKGVSNCITNRLLNRARRAKNTPKKMVQRKMQQSSKKIENLPNGGIRISHTEYCGMVDFTSAKPANYNDYGVASEHEYTIYPINPGDGRTFPWLSGMAARFEKYRVKNLRLHYKPTCSAFESGGIAICPIYDPSESPPADRGQLLNAQDVVRGNVYSNITCVVKNSALRGNDTMYVRTKHVSLSDPNERRLDDLGYFCVLLTNTLAASTGVTFGELFVSYTVELYNPRFTGDAPKSAIITSSEPNTRPGGSEHHAFFHEDITQANVNPGSTLGIELTTDNDSGITHTTTTQDVNLSDIKFLEPFNGIVEVTSQHMGSIGASEATVVANGHPLYMIGYDPAELVWDVATERKTRRRCRFRPIKSIKNGVNTVVHTLHVVAQAGEFLSLGLEEFATVSNHIGAVIMTEVVPAVAEAMEVLSILA